jgi:hypothetical protein
MPRRTLLVAPALALAIAAMPSGALAKPAHAGAHAAKADNAVWGKGRPAGTGGGRRIR